MNAPKHYTCVPCWNDEEAREFLLRLIERLGLSVKEVLEGEQNWLYKVSMRISS